MRFAVVDSCPVPSGAAPLVVEAKHRSGETLESCFRGSEARAILARFGKHDQAYLWNGWVRRLPGFNPANPPGFSTHECFNDGPAFPSIRRGGRIPEVCVGQDWSNGAHVVQVYRAMGVNAALTYPGSVREKQHINIRQAPKNLKLPLKLWDKGKRVVPLANHLMECERPNGKRYLESWPGRSGKRFGTGVEDALKAFQRDHGLAPDGVYGPLSEHQLDLAYAHWKKVHAAKPHPPVKNGGKKPPRPHPSVPSHAVMGHWKGIDVSNNNGDIDWGKVARSGVLYAYLRATEGLTGHGSEDETFTAGRLKVMRQARVIPGYYHYVHPQPGRSAKDECHHFFNYVNSRGGWDQPIIMPPWVDVEWQHSMGQHALASWVLDFCIELEHLLQKKISKARRDTMRAIHGLDVWVPGIYTGGWFWNPQLGDPKGFEKYPLSYSYYTASAHMPPSLPRSWQKKGLTWLQHTSKGSVPGVHGDCDMDIYFGPLDLKRLGR
jgi:GH25 family lysozyme M1 (1,4-beta-N-acetylmuramidase)